MKNFIYVLTFFLIISVPAQKDNQPIYAQVSGKGKPILLLPGFTVPGDSWLPIIKELEANYECHAITLAGFGRKKAIDFPWLPKVNEALENYISKNNLKSITVIGHSLGGTIAAWLASREKNNIEKIILVDALPATGALMIPNYNPDYLVYESPFNKQQLNMSTKDFENLANSMSKGMSLNKDAQNNIKKWMLQADRKTYVYGYTDYLKFDIRENLKNIKIPVTLLAAEKPYGKDMVKQTYDNQYKNLANYDFVIAENSAHFIMFDQPEWFLKQIKKSLALK
ncbi:alpha/beta hydrolase [Tenacibaculum sp. SZ-18]|uniref:alpha/beta fold hydrolase n=1 Tax=Tenacibaculum sp. SZ-18 TaxID=754423 RepID=UPI000C2D4114|nr:alpha/beta hydrolase [Tenacibaculum sp. SZ-18]AUC14139.1 alpha/beta hydrolase [Tenacibaculum sp. SZ-18]